MHTIRPVYVLLLVLLLPVAAFAQLKKYGPVLTAPPTPKIEKNARRHAVNPIALPFWDDFSGAKGHSADSLLWIDNNKVFINNGQGINPPTLNVATFDGYNENGIPYSNAPLETGYGDTLESQPIRLKDVPRAQRSNIYLSFFYQPGGNSEMPNPSDFLKLEFKGKNGWVEIKRFHVKANVDRTVFYDTAIQIPQTLVFNTTTGTNDTIFYQNDFQFRFTSFGRLSGAYDAWHLDYVYLNKRIFNDKNTNISDRALTKPFSSAFGDFYSIPYTHFILDPDDYLENINFEVFDLKDSVINGVDDYILNYKRFYSVFNYKESSLLSSYVQPDLGDQPLEPILSRERKTYEIVTPVNPANFNTNADSVSLVFRLELGSGDNEEDYYSRYHPINFKQNDVVSDTFLLSNYYAYDDGVAEYTAGLAVQGNQLAYRFIIDNIDEDTLNGAYIYFPYFGGTVPQTMQLYVFGNTNGRPDINEMYSQTIPVTRTANNLFSEINFTEGVIVRDTFYIGYLETQTGAPDRIRIGLDASHDTGQHMFYRNTILHAWQQNDVVKGNLMIRPRFGKATVITGVEDDPKPVSIYPNPNKGEFYMKGIVTKLQIATSTGQPVNFAVENFNDSKKITLHVVPGLYLVRYQCRTKVYTDKIIVTGN